MGNEVVLGFGDSFKLPNTAGGYTRAWLRGGWFDPYPRLEVMGVRYRTGRMPLGLRLWLFAPVLLAVVGGFVGAGFALLAVAVNAAIGRSTMPDSAKAMSMFAVLASTIGLWLGLVEVILRAVPR